MVMEASSSPSPQSVGREFVRQYYTLLNKAPAHLHRFYNNYSSFVHGGLDAVGRETPPVIGQKQIHHRIQQLNFRDCHAKISQVDSQATLGNGVVVQVSGELSNGGAPMRRFTQTFVLAAQSPKKYYVHNDIFRYQDIVFSDSEGSGSGRSEGEEEEAPPYFPPLAAGTAPQPFPPPPPVPAAALPPVLPPLPPAGPAHHLNGHPAAPAPGDDTARLVAQTMQSASLGVESDDLSVEAVEPEPEPEPPVEPSQGMQPPAASAPQEPKTYANLLKAAGPPPATPGPALAPVHVPASQPAFAPADRTRPPRMERDRERDRDRDRERDRERDRDRDVLPSAGPAGEGGGASVGVGGASVGGGPLPRRYSDAHQLFLGNVPHGASETALRALFARFGALHELRLLAKPQAPGGRGHPNYGFITFESAAGASACLRAQPLYFPPDSADAVKLNVEEKKRREPRRRAHSGGRSSHCSATPPLLYI